MKRKSPRILFLLLFLLAIGNYSVAQKVSSTQVKEYAINFIQSVSPDKTVSYSPEIIPFQSSMQNGKETVYTYVVNFEPDGWILMSADKRIEPVLAYSLEGSFDVDNTEDLPFGFWFTKYQDQISNMVQQDDLEMNSNWEQLGLENKSNAIEPLIEVEWDQDSGWNSFCPEDDSGPGGHAYAGCVAVAMAQNMSIYQYPNTGTGSKTHISDYGALTVNFEETEYNWDLTHPTSPNEHIAIILYHLGVAVNMQYSASGSGAFSRDVPTAIKTYFDYSNEAKLLSKNDFENESEWIEIIENELSEGRPLYYAGDGNNNEAGHAWNLDGMDGSGRFHFNWGWGGSYNGYYYLHTLNPGSNNFSYNQQAIVNFRPRNHLPQDIILSDNSVQENLPEGSLVGTLEAVDETPDDFHVFEVRGPESVFGFFIDVPFDVEDNNLITTEVLNISNKDEYEIFVTATDSIGNQYTKRFVIEIIANSSGQGDPTTVISQDNQNELKIWQTQPFSSFISLELNNSYHGEVVVQIFNIAGQQIFLDSFYKASDNYTNMIDAKLTDNSGIYLFTLEFTDRNERLTRKVLLNYK